LTHLNNQGTPIASYHFAKAQAWLDMAMDHYVMNDRSRVVEDALGQAGWLIEQLEDKKSVIARDTGILPTSKVIRTDLWRLAVELKQSPGFSCGEDLVARLEVQLVWAGHEENQLGWRNAKPYIQAAERLASEAKRKIDTCPAAEISAAQQPPLPLTDVTVGRTDGPALPDSLASSPAAAPGGTDSNLNQTPAPAATTVAVPDRVHFALNSARLSSRSAAVLERLAVVLATHPSVTVELQGHADERGNETFNQKLSLRRAEVVRTYLVATGIDRVRVTLRACGGSQPAQDGNDSESHARNRRVEFHVAGDTAQLRMFPQQEELRIEE